MLAARKRRHQSAANSSAPSSRLTFLMVRRAVTALFFILLLAGWELAVRQGWISSIIIPKPSDVARYFLDLKRDESGAVVTPWAWEGSLTDGTLLNAIWVTM